jgi:hypothetical protein
MGAGLLSLYVWNRPYTGINFNLLHGIDNDPAAQALVLRTHPQVFLDALANQLSLTSLMDYWAQNHHFISWPVNKPFFDWTYMSTWVSDLGLAAVVIAGLLSTGALRAWQRFVLVFTAFGHFVATTLVFWIGATPVGSSAIIWMAGRYFPLDFALVALAFGWPWLADRKGIRILQLGLIGYQGLVAAAWVVVLLHNQTP